MVDRVLKKRRVSVIRYVIGGSMIHPCWIQQDRTELLNWSMDIPKGWKWKYPPMTVAGKLRC